LTKRARFAVQTRRTENTSIGVLAAGRSAESQETVGARFLGLAGFPTIHETAPDDGGVGFGSGVRISGELTDLMRAGTTPLESALLLKERFPRVQAPPNLQDLRWLLPPGGWVDRNKVKYFTFRA
jgi:hypothetical protein